MAAAPAISLVELEKDPRLFLYTSLTAGSSHIITATSRLETILKANKIPFQAIDMATDEKARRLWQRRAGGRKLPGLVKEGYVIGDLNEVEEWNEFGELKENIGPVPANNAAPPSGGQVGVQIAPPSIFASQQQQQLGVSASKPTASMAANNVYGQSGVPAAKLPEAGFDRTKMIALPSAAEAAAKANAAKAAQASEKATASSTAPADAPVKSSEAAAPTSSSIVDSEPVPPTSTLEAINPETRTSKAETAEVTKATDSTTTTAAAAAPAAVVSPPQRKMSVTFVDDIAASKSAAEASPAVPQSIAASLAEAKAAKSPPATAAATTAPVAGTSATKTEVRTVAPAAEGQETAKEESIAAKIQELKIDEQPTREAETVQEKPTAEAAAEKADEPKKTQEQDPKEAKDATVSVED